MRVIKLPSSTDMLALVLVCLAGKTPDPGT